MNPKNSNIDRSTLNPEAWVDHYGDYLYRFALSLVRDPSVAEDLVQETFLAALSARKKYAGRSSERTWLTGILKHKIADYFRKKAKEPSGHDIESGMQILDGLFDSQGKWKVKPVEWAANPQELYERQAFMKIFNECLTGLSSRLASVFILREMIGETTEEICKVLDISATNYWVILHRARGYLRRCLEINWFTSTNTED
jgi:RNA polymerase sigma-70 factor (ECF subfamily)